MSWRTNHDKDDVLPKAEGLWVDILTKMTDVDSDIFDHTKEHPCPCCGGKTRFRYRRNSSKKLDKPFFCNHCGAKNGIQLLMAITGYSFFDAINAVGDHLALIPADIIQTAKVSHSISIRFPHWYNYDIEIYDSIKEAATVDLSAWQKINGLNMLDILKHGDNALLPLLNESGEPCDFVMINHDGLMQTTGGNKIVPSGFYSTFGTTIGKRNYIAVSPLVAAHAAVFTQIIVHCCYTADNIWDVARDFEEDPVIICASIEEVQEADSLKFEQLMFNAKNNTVNRRLWKPFEYMDERKKANDKGRSN